MAETVTLKEFVDAQIQSLKDQIANIRDDTGTAKADLEKRLEGMNEFRDTLRDQAGKFITRSEVDVMMDATNKGLQELKLEKARIEGIAAGKASQGAFLLAVSLGVLGLLLSAIGIVLQLRGSP